MADGPTIACQVSAYPHQYMPDTRTITAADCCGNPQLGEYR